jgi:predicted amidophosphoribosyltransferase
MFCPSCKAEFRRGITRCSDCDIELVEAVPKVPSSDSSSGGNLVLLWSGDNLALRASLLEELKAAGVPYFDRPIGNYSHKAFPNRRLVSGMSLFGFEVSVLSSDSERAKAILGRVTQLSCV